MTTFTTEDRIISEKDGSVTINVEPIPFAGMVNIYDFKDVGFPGFNFRFIKQGSEWVCKMDEWLVDQAISYAKTISEK